MNSKRDKSPDAETDELIHHLPAWVLGGLVNDHAGQISIKCLRAVSEVAAELKALGVIGETRKGKAGVVEILFDQEGGDSVLIKVSSDGKVSQKSVRGRGS